MITDRDPGDEQPEPHVPRLDVAVPDGYPRPTMTTSGFRWPVDDSRSFRHGGRPR